MILPCILFFSLVLASEGRKIPDVHVHLYLGKKGAEGSVSGSDYTVKPAGSDYVICGDVDCKSSNRGNVNIECCSDGTDYSDDSEIPENENDEGADGEGKDQEDEAHEEDKDKNDEEEDEGKTPEEENGNDYTDDADETIDEKHVELMCENIDCENPPNDFIAVSCCKE